jgi:hypothetical protein
MEIEDEVGWAREKEAARFHHFQAGYPGGLRQALDGVGLGTGTNHHIVQELPVGRQCTYLRVRPGRRGNNCSASSPLARSTVASRTPGKKWPSRLDLPAPGCFR